MEWSAGPRRPVGIDLRRDKAVNRAWRASWEARHRLVGSDIIIRRVVELFVLLQMAMNAPKGVIISKEFAAQSMEVALIKMVIIKIILDGRCHSVIVGRTKHHSASSFFRAEASKMTEK